MLQERQVARDISYAHSASTQSGRMLIRLMENATGRISLIKRARGYKGDISEGRDFWQVMVDRFGLDLDIVRGSLDNIPIDGPVIVIANHPYGILDGLIMGHILRKTRGDFRILANKVFSNADDLKNTILPISFDETRDAVQENLTTRKVSMQYLAAGGAIGIFPGGTVSTAATPFAHPMDPGWRSFTARLIAKSGAKVVPVYFDGHTSRLFQVASHLHTTLRMGLLIREFKARVDTPVRVAIGTPISADDIAKRSGDSKALMDFLRKETYQLAPKRVRSYDYGYDFNERQRA